MKILIAEDDYVNRRFLFKFFSEYGDCDIVVDGKEALEAFIFALDEGLPYDLICLDVMMPKMDGLRALKAITAFENERDIDAGEASKKFIITALDGAKDVEEAFGFGCEVYVTKPINTEKLLEVMKRLKFNKV